MSIPQCTGECNLACFYNGVQSIDQGLLRKYNFQGMEIYALLKSLNITQPFLSSVCSQATTGVTPSEYQPPLPVKLIIDSNQMLAIGYSHIQLGFPIILSIFPGVEVVVRNGGKIVIFNDNSLVNYGEIFLDNAALILESENTSRLINNGCITLKTSFLVGKGVIFNSGRINISCYSKVSIGKEKGITSETVEETDSDMDLLSFANLTKQSPVSSKTVSTLDFAENYSRVINSGYFIMSSYSTFELEGSLLNGKGEVANCFMEQLNGYLPQDLHYDPGAFSTQNALIQLSSNSRFTFTFGNNLENEFMNDVGSFITFEMDTQVVIQRLESSSSKNTIVNRGTLTLNGEATFKSVNLDNFYLVQNTYEVDSTSPGGFRFFYAKTLFTSQLDPAKISNISKESCICVAPTCTFYVDGYNIVNYGSIIVGKRLHSVESPLIVPVSTILPGAGVTTLASLAGAETLECSEQLFPAMDLSRNATFVYGYITINPNLVPVTLKNFSRISIAPKSIVMIGKNSSLTNSGRPQATMLNQGTIFNHGLLQVNRNSEIVNRPCPFNINNEEYSIINGGVPSFNSNAVILIRKPDNGLDTGGYIKTVSALLYNGGKVKNNSTGIIISWVGYEREVIDDCTTCILVYGLQATVTGSGKTRIIPYPNISTWNQECLQEYLQQQAQGGSTDYGF